MLAKQTKVALALTAMLVAGCTTPTSLIQEPAKTVHLRMDSQFDVEKCQWLGEVVGSSGHWYSYLFYSNDVMIQGAINDIKNRAKQLGATHVYTVHPQDFVTSFTLMGSAYNCPKESK
jgi:hypothetical protein